VGFHDTRLPEEVEQGSSMGPVFSTTIFATASGFEQRNINWAQPRLAADLGYGLQFKDPSEAKNNYSEIIAFFYARQGRAHSFRFKDWSDFAVGDTNDVTTRQLIAVGDTVETQFQIIKTYTSGTITFDRTLTKIVSGTLRVWENDVEVFSPGTWTVDLLTGIITFGSAPAAVDIEVICEFDVPVRFTQDALVVSLQQVEAGEIPNVPVLEVRGE